MDRQLENIVKLVKGFAAGPGSENIDTNDALWFIEGFRTGEMDERMIDPEALPELQAYVDELNETKQTVKSVFIGSARVYDFIEHFDSYISDVETNLETSYEAWCEYEEDPQPFVEDLLFDFGTRFSILDNLERAVAIKNAAYHWAH